MSAASVPRLQPNPKFAHLASVPRLDETVRALQAHGFDVRVAADSSEARRIVLELLPDGSSVFDSTSKTLEATGIAEAIRTSGKVESLRAQLIELGKAGKTAEQRRLGAAPDVIVGSVHAVTEQGQVVIASGSGSQLAPYASGAGRVIWVVGTQKIVADLDEALARVYEYSFPLENERAKQVYGKGSFVSKILIVNADFAPGRTTLVFVKENLGF